MIKIGLIGAMDNEVEALCRKLKAKKINSNPDVFFSEHTYKKIYICSSGVGKVNAAIMTQKLIDSFGIDCIINMGVAGAVDRTLNECDVVISEKLTYHDFNPLELLNRYPPYSTEIFADEKLISLASGACRKLNAQLKYEGKDEFSVKTGMIVSGDCFVDSSEKIKELDEKFSALCTEMEGAAIAHTAKVNNIPFVVIRVISDFADENSQNSLDTFEKIAAYRSNFIAFNMIEEL